MLISLLGYMGSGKSHISKILSQKINFKLFDLDHEIISVHNLNIATIFKLKGEIYFRKEENRILKELLLSKNNCILSLGGGTPVYFNNIDLINEHSESVFLQTSVGNLTERLIKQKAKRPLIANIDDENLPEFIAKHLFERNPFYAKAKHIINTDHKSPEEIVDEIIKVLGL